MLLNLPIIISEDIDKILSSSIYWGNFRDTTVLISGAAGFFPAYFVYCLLALNQRHDYNTKIIGLVRNMETARERFSSFLTNNQLRLIQNNDEWCFSVPEQLDYIIHAASPASPAKYLQQKMFTLNANCLGTYSLLKLAREKSVRSFLYFSSAEIYGNVNTSSNGLSESELGILNHMADRAAYSESKKVGETMCFLAKSEWGVHAQIIRPFHIFGPGMALNDGRIYADFVRDILSSSTLRIKGSGENIRSFCYLSDAVEGSFRVLLSGDCLPYNIGNPENSYSTKELAQQLVSLFPDKKLSVVIEGQDNGAAQAVIPDISRMCSLGWKPNVSISEGFKRTITSYQ